MLEMFGIYFLFSSKFGSFFVGIVHCQLVIWVGSGELNSFCFLGKNPLRKHVNSYHVWGIQSSKAAGPKEPTSHWEIVAFLFQHEEIHSSNWLPFSDFDQMVCMFTMQSKIKPIWINEVTPSKLTAAGSENDAESQMNVILIHHISNLFGGLISNYISSVSQIQPALSELPLGSMYSMFIYMCLVLIVNVGKLPCMDPISYEISKYPEFSTLLGSLVVPWWLNFLSTLPAASSNDSSCISNMKGPNHPKR